MNDKRLTLNQIANTVGISDEQVENILHNELGMSKVSERWMPQLLTPDQKLTRLTMLQANLAFFFLADQASILDHFLTQDECWVHHFEPETKRQLMLWKHPGSPPPSMARLQGFRMAANANISNTNKINLFS